MMALRLEVFETPDDAIVVTDRSAQEEARAAAWAEGFAAGEAAARAAAETAAQAAGQRAAESLQEIAFGYHEARAAVLAGLKPLLTEIAAVLLPQIARESLAPCVAAVLMPLAEAQAGAPIRLRHHPAAGAALAALTADAALPILLTPDETLAEAEVHLHAAGAEACVDLSRAAHDITAAIRGFFALTQQDRLHG